jgi:hypothetical protein
MADSPNDQINVYQGYSYSMNLTNESMVPVHFEDRWGSTNLISNPFAPTDDIVLVDAGLNSTLEVGTTLLQPNFINSYDGGMGNDTLVVDLANMTKEDKAVFVNFKAAFIPFTKMLPILQGLIGCIRLPFKTLKMCSFFTLN